MKENLIATALIIGLLLIFAIAGSADSQVAAAQQCYARTHSQACTNQ